MVEVLVESLVLQIGITLFVAMLLGSFFAKLKQSAIAGYLIAGILLGPYALRFITEADTTLLSLFSELGILMLLFFIGLELDVKKFKQGGLMAFVLGPAKMVTCFVMGYAVGLAFGFNQTESILLGLVIFCSSTAVIGKWLMDNKLMQSLEARISIPMLLIEDFACVVILALLSTYGSQGTVNEVVLNSIFFIIVSIYVIGRFSGYLIKFIEKFEYEKHITLYALGMMLALSWLASFFGLSPAIGAFLGGFMISGLIHAEKIKNELAKFADFFAAFFFVGIGLHFVPTSIDLIFVGLVILLIYIVGQFISYSFFGLLVGLKTSFSIRMASIMITVGEFSLIIAAVATTMGLPRADEIVALSIFLCITSTFAMPYCIRYADPISVFMARIVPSYFKRKFSFVSGKTTGLIQKSLEDKKVQEGVMYHFKKLGGNVFSVLGLGYLLYYANIHSPTALIEGIPNYVLLFILGIILSIPSVVYSFREIKLIMLEVLEFSSPDVLKKYSSRQVRIIEEAISDLFVSFFLIIVSALLVIMGFMVSVLFFIPAILIVVGSSFTFLWSFHKIRKERKFVKRKK